MGINAEKARGEIEEVHSTIQRVEQAIISLPYETPKQHTAMENAQSRLNDFLTTEWEDLMAAFK